MFKFLEHAFAELLYLLGHFCCEVFGFTRVFCEVIELPSLGTVVVDDFPVFVAVISEEVVVVLAVWEMNEEALVWCF